MIDDLSAYIIAGRVKPLPSTVSETAGRTPRQGVQDGVDAEAIGFRRVFLSERWNLKEAGAILGGVGARTQHIGLATGVIPPTARHPLHAAALASTMNAAYGPRFVLGLGRGDGGAIGQETGLRTFAYQATEDYVDIIRRLWRGDTVDYDGPAGRFGGLRMDDRHDGPDPEIWFGSFGMPRSAKTAALCMDGVLLIPNLTPEATHASVTRLREACERADRDPSSLRIAQCVITAPDLDEVETRQLCHARALTYLQAPGYGDTLCAMNGWGADRLAEIRAHAQLKNHATLADNVFHRAELEVPARAVPDQWMHDSCAIGSVSECVDKLRTYQDAGADEVVTYGSTPGQNAGLAKAWAQRRVTP
jgi:5,10-methylenetetrahydromethanopterin reductase